jgi:hypothetical protein
MATSNTESLAVTAKTWVLAVDGAAYAKVDIDTAPNSGQVCVAVAASIPANNVDSFVIIEKGKTKSFVLNATDKLYVRLLRDRLGKIRMVRTTV